MSVTSFIKGIGKGRGKKKAGPRTPRAAKAAQTAPEKPLVAPAVNTTFMAKRIGLTAMMTEKAVKTQLQQRVVFRVTPEATKAQIAQAVFEQYNVHPRRIRTLRFAGKRRTRGRTVGFTSRWKKAYVTVPDVKDLKIAP